MTADLDHARLIAALTFPPPEGPPAKHRAKTKDPLGDLREGEDEILSACQRNKVPLLALSLGDTALASSKSWQSARCAEARQWRSQRQEYVPVFQALTAAGVPNVLIKSAGIPPSLPYRSDNLDLLVHRRDGQRARELLLDLGYVELLNVEEPDKFLFRKFSLGESVSAIHLHTFVGWGTEFLSAERVLQGARPSLDDPAVVIPSAEDGLLITMAHAFYEDKAISLGDIWKVRHLLRGGSTSRRSPDELLVSARPSAGGPSGGGGEIDWDDLDRQTTARGWLAGLDTCVLIWSALEAALYDAHSFPPAVVERARQRAPEWCLREVQARLEREPRFPWGVSFRFSKRHYYGKVLRDQDLRPAQKGVDIALHSWAGVKRRLPLRLQRPMLVALSGIDGSGKTTQAEYLLKALRVCDIDARRVWSRGGSSPLTDAAIGLARRFLPRQEGLDVQSDTRQAKVARKGVWLRRPLLRLGWMGLVGADLALRYAAQVAWPLLNRWVVVGDRYLVDAVVEMAALTESPQLLASWPARLLARLCPRPQAAYLLDLSPQRAATRDPEELLPFLEQQAALYRLAAPIWGMQVIDADADLTQVSDALTRQVLRSYYARWRRSIPYRIGHAVSGAWAKGG